MYAMNDCYTFSIPTNSLERKEYMNMVRSSHGLFKMHQKLFAFGGFDHFKIPTKSAEVYDVVKNTWKKLPDMPERGQFITCVKVKNQILLSS